MDDELQALVVSLIPQVKAIAWRYYIKAPHALERDELESIAFTGLMDAATKWPDYCRRNEFQPDGPGLKYFGAYVSRRVNGAILDHLRSVDWVTRSVRQKAKRIDAAQAQGAKTTAELADRSGLSLEDVHDTAASLARRPVSLDDGERDVAEEQDVESSAQVTAILRAVAQAGEMLSRLERVVLALRYYEEMAMPAIALALGKDRREVAAAHDSGVRAVREAMLTAVA